MKNIESKKKKELKKALVSQKPIINLGKDGLSENMVGEIKRQLKENELIKIKVLKAALAEKNKEEIANEIADATDSEIVEVKGYNLGLFRPKHGWKK